MTNEKPVLRGRVIHVNEDGWLVLNLGTRDGVLEGQRFAVLGERRPRQIRDPFAPASPTSARPPVLRADTAYELLRVILVEPLCCVAISERVPPERTPQPFLGPQGELLLYTPAPADWRYDALDFSDNEEDEAEEETDNNEEEAAEEDSGTQDEAGEVRDAADGASSQGEDTADLMARQQEHLWDGSLPLNAVQVGDEVILAQPYVSGALARRSASQPGAQNSGAAASAQPPDSPLTPPAPYDWLKPS